MRAAERDAKVAAAVQAREAAAQAHLERVWDEVMFGTDGLSFRHEEIARKSHRLISRMVSRGFNRQVTCTSDNHNPEWKEPVQKVEVFDLPAKPGKDGLYETYWCRRCIAIHWVERAIATKEEQQRVLDAGAAAAESPAAA